GVGMFPQKTYVLASWADLWPLIANAPVWSVFSGTSIVVSDLPLLSVVSPNAGLGSSCEQVPLCTWSGCATPAGAPLIATTTFVLSPSDVRVAVPDSPEVFCGVSCTVTGPAACAGPVPAAASSPASANAIPRDRIMVILLRCTPSLRPSRRSTPQASRGPCFALAC